MNIGVHGSLEIKVFPFLQIYTQSGNAGSYDSSIFSFFGRISILFFIVAVPIYISTDSVQVFSILHIFANHFYCGLFDDSHSDRCDVISHCGFICISLMISDAEYLHNEC